MRLEVLERTAECVIARWDRLLLVRWRDSVTVDGVQRIQAQVTTLRAAHGGEVVLFSLIPPRSSKPPDPAAQAAIHDLTQGSSPGLAGVAIVFEGGGFIAATVMALTLKLGGGGNAGTPTRVFRTLEEAAGWAGERLGPPKITVDGLRASLATAMG